MKLKKNKTETRTNVSIRFSSEEFNRAMQKAFAYCDGNFSEWVRYAARECVPNPKDLINEDEESEDDNA